MRRLNVDIVVPQVHPKRFSGGILCIFEHAQGLSDAGHHVRVVPISPSPYPEWFTDIRFDYYEHSRYAQEKNLDSAAKAFPRSILSGVIGKADVTLATTCDTLMPVTCNASGPKIYFMQHFAGSVTKDTSAHRADDRQLQDLANHAHRLLQTTRNIHYNHFSRIGSALLCNRLNNPHCACHPGRLHLYLHPRSLVPQPSEHIP